MKDPLHAESGRVALSRARRAERTAAERLRIVFEQAPVAVSVVRGPDFVYELTNAHYEELVGRTGLVGKRLREAFPELSSDGPLFKALEFVWTTGQSLTSAECTILYPGPSAAAAPTEVSLRFTCQPLWKPDGTFDALIAVAVDVSQQKQARRAMQDLLRREQAARHAVERANRVTDEFLRTLSHELRTPLNAVLGWVGLLGTGTIEEGQMDHALETIERNAKAQSQLIDTLLDFSRISQGKLHVSLVQLDMHGIVADAVDEARSSAERRGVLLESDLVPDVSVFGDAQRLRQIARNLLSNAIKFTPEGGHVRVRLERNSGYVEFTVSDTGKGIEPSFLPHVFERFRQEDSALTRSAGGLGLGLAIVRSLVESHGGTVMATSAGTGRGAQFTVRLPAITAGRVSALAPPRS